MQHSIRIVDVKGLHVLSSKTIFELESVTLVEGERRGLSFQTWLGFTNMKKILQENPDYFKDDNNHFLLISEDDRTYQCLHVYEIRFEFVDKDNVKFDLLINSSPSDYFLRVMDYLVRKEEKKRDEERLDALKEKILDTIKEATDRDE